MGQIIKEKLKESMVRDYLKDARNEFIKLAKQMKENGIIADYEVKPYTSDVGKDEYGNRLDRMKYDEWCRVKINGVKDSDKFYELRNNLMDKWKVAFDMGGSAGYVDWELDWSLRTCASGEDLKEYLAKTGIVDEIIKKMNKKNEN